MIAKTNSKMKKYLSDIDGNSIPERITVFINNIISNVKIIKGCTIYDIDGITDDDVDLERVLKYVGDLTGYEMGCNEFELESISDVSLMNIATYFLTQIKNKYIERKFVVYIFAENNMFILRFHTFREDEGIWLDEDIEQYENAVMYIMD